MDKYLVTGGAGFIGSHIVEELINQGHSVRVLDDFSTGKRKNIFPFIGNIELWSDDIKNKDACKRLVKDVDYVFHQAALPSVIRSFKNPHLVNDVNAKGTLNILQASKEAKVKRFIFASSSSVYGDDCTMPKVEHRIGNPLSPYAISKLVSEYYCYIFSKVYGLYTVCLRYFNVFGPRQDPLSEYAAVIPTFITKMIKGKSPIINGDGLQSRDFTYISNVVYANLLAVKARNVSGKVFNVACNKSTTIDSLASNINEILKTEIRFSYTEPRKGDIRHSFADISEARKQLKYEPLVPFSKGLRKTINWFRKQK